MKLFPADDKPAGRCCYLRRSQITTSSVQAAAARTVVQVSLAGSCRRLTGVTKHDIRSDFCLRAADGLGALLPSSLESCAVVEKYPADGLSRGLYRSGNGSSFGSLTDSCLCLLVSGSANGSIKPGMIQPSGSLTAVFGCGSMSQGREARMFLTHGLDVTAPRR